MNVAIAVVAGLPSRREALARALEDEGWRVVPAADAAPPGGCALTVLDLTDTPPDAALRTTEGLLAWGPVVAVGGKPDLPALRAALEGGAADVVVDIETELTLRVRRALDAERSAATRRKRESALVELAAAAGENLEPTAVVRAILGWLQRALPGSEPEVVVTPSVAGGRIRLVRPGPGRSLTFGHTQIAQRPELQRVFEGERFVHLRETRDPSLAPARERLLCAGWADAVLLSLRDGGEPASALVVRSRRQLGAGELALVRAAAALSSRALLNARTYDATARERQRLESAYADRYRELLETNHRLRKLAHQKEELLAICAHDLRAPLGELVGNARLLLDGERGELADPVREGVEAMRMQAARTLEIVEDLLDIHGLETGRLELKAQPLDLGALTREVCDALRVHAAERSVRIEVRMPDAGLRLSGDSSKLREVIANLVGNAIKFSPPGETVSVRVEAMDGVGGRVVVSDRGPGIPPEMLGHLVGGAPVPRSESGRGNGPGRGLGLAIAREITMLHGGRLTAESELGSGTTFVVELPRRPGAERPAAPAAPPAPQERRESDRPRVLVVEDDEDVRQLLVDLLEDDHEVLEAGDGVDGVRVAREELPDVVLMDLFLPRLDGFGALEEIKRDPRTSEIPVLFLSAERDESARVRGLELGAADFVVKPFSAVELRARITRTLRAAQQQEQLRAIAQTDALTGLPNYRAFRMRLDEELKRARRYHTPLAAVMIDLDNLKPINDQLGHAAGNRAIVALAEAVTQQLRETDFAARYGGDEFVLLLPHTTSAEARALADRLRRAIRRVEVDGPRLPLRASLGVAALAAGTEASADALIRAADAALYRAKRTGRDRVCVAGEDGGARSEATELM